MILWAGEKLVKGIKEWWDYHSGGAIWAAYLLVALGTFGHCYNHYKVADSHKPTEEDKVVTFLQAFGAGATWPLYVTIHVTADIWGENPFRPETTA